MERRHGENGEERERMERRHRTNEGEEMKIKYLFFYFHNCFDSDLFGIRCKFFRNYGW